MNLSRERKSTRWSPRRLASSLVLSLVIVTTMIALSASATTRIQRAMLLRYPQLTGTRLARCATCHAAELPALNPYGRDLRRAKLSFFAIEAMDSDRDGYSNRTEIRALSFPGDSTDRPAADFDTTGADRARYADLTR